MTSSTFVRDSRHALRALLRTPGFTAIAALTFGLGIGVNTAVFSVFDGVVLRPLPYPDPDRITMVWMDNRQQGIKEDITSWPNYQDWRNQSSSFAVMAGYTGAAFNLTGAEEPERPGDRPLARFRRRRIDEGVRRIEADRSRQLQSHGIPVVRSSHDGEARASIRLLLEKS